MREFKHNYGFSLSPVMKLVIHNPHYSEPSEPIPEGGFKGVIDGLGDFINERDIMFSEVYLDEDVWILYVSFEKAEEIREWLSTYADDDGPMEDNEIFG